MRFYKVLISLIIVLGLSTLTVELQAQSAAELKTKIQASTDSEERMYLYFDLAQKANSIDDKIKAAREANDLAFKIRNYDMQSRASLFLGDLLSKKSQRAQAQKSYESALSNSKKAKNIDLFIQAVDKLGKLKVRERNYSAAYNIYKENFNFLSKSGVNLLDATKEEAVVRSRSRILTKESDRLEKERKKLLDAIASLKNKQYELEQESSDLRKKTKNLEAENQEAQVVIDSTTTLLDSVEQEQLETQEYIEKKDRMIRSLNSEKERERLVKEKLEQDYELTKLVAEKQELELEKSQNRWIIMLILSLLILGLALSLYLRYRSKQKANKELENLNREIKRGQERSEELLLNILPEQVAEELKTTKKSTAKKFMNASVLFTDFKNFTTIAEKLSPEQLVKDLDECFRAFDYILAEYNIEKIKTVGDAYMCANGISERPENPDDMIRAAFAFQAFLEKSKLEKIRLNKPFFEARIGIHTGPVVAGVVGVKKFAYDIWGDTVNIASRMESSCEPGKINISETTYRKVSHKFDCQYRGELQVKNKGGVRMYYVQREK